MQDHTCEHSLNNMGPLDRELGARTYFCELSSSVGANSYIQCTCFFLFKGEKIVAQLTLSPLGNGVHIIKKSRVVCKYARATENENKFTEIMEEKIINRLTFMEVKGDLIFKITFSSDTN